MSEATSEEIIMTISILVTFWLIVVTTIHDQRKEQGKPRKWWLCLLSDFQYPEKCKKEPGSSNAMPE